MTAAVEWRVRTRTLGTADHTLVMGVLNVTPDSFSDGGRFDRRGDGSGVDHGAAVRAGLEMWEDGADLIDVGGESTRPGSSGIGLDEELDRVVPVVAELTAEGVTVSVDTTKREVAATALDSGAEVINDITALGDEAMAALCAERGAGVVLMHMQGTPTTMQHAPTYTDVLSEVRDYLLARADAAIRTGVQRERICIDPGIGFGKSFADNLNLLARLDVLVGSGFPVLVGSSRKAFLGAILDGTGHGVLARERDHATSATTALAVAAGVAVVRVHDVAAAVQAARTADAIVRGSGRTVPN